jgi:hypothetical protein
MTGNGREAENSLGPFGNRPRRLSIGLTVALVFVAAFQASGQRVRLVGSVRDSAGTPVFEADVSIPASHLLTRSDRAGVFTMDHVPVGATKLAVRRLGYEPQYLDIAVENGATDTIRVVMRVQAQILAGMDISAQEMRRRAAIEDFYRRAVRGQGNYITREDITERHAIRLSDALAGVPGLDLVRRGGHRGMAVRFMNSSVVRRDCVPQYWLDGVRVDDVEIDDFSPSDIEGIELYQGPSTTPLQFSQGSATKCGAVVIWTRIPGT